MQHLHYRAVAAACLSLLAACGGSGTDPATMPTFTTTGGDSPVTLAAVSLDSAARSTASLSGTLDPTTDTYSVGTLSGDINADRTQVALSDGGQVILTHGTYDFAVLFEATPLNGARTIGVVGNVTPEDELPGGTANYTGSATVTLRDGVSVYELIGDASIAADFGTGTVTTTASRLSGTQATALTAPVDVTDVATVTFTGSSISGAGFASGTPSITSSTVTDLGANPASDLNGAFFGPAGDEAGATFVIDDADDSGVIAFGTVIAD